MMTAQSLQYCRLKFHVPHQIAPHVAQKTGSWFTRMMIGMTQKSQSLNRVDWIRMRNTVFVHNQMPFQSRCRPADLTAYNTHYAIRSLQNTRWQWSVNVRLHKVHIPSAFERTCPHVPQIQFAWSHGKFYWFPFLNALFSFAPSKLLTWREPQPVFNYSRQAPR